MNKIYLLLILIIILASFLRIFKIDSAPSSLTWDEAAVGYNAFVIANYGKDEYGKSFPLYLQSFGEDKQPIHIYITAIFVKLFGLNEFTTRLPAAIFGILDVFLLFFLAKSLFGNQWIGLLGSFFLAISPQHIHFSRFNHEANFALFFFMLGLLFFLESLKQRKYFLPLSIMFFFLSTISYHAAEIAVPLICLLIAVLYFKQLKQNKYNLIISFILITGLLIFSFFQPRLFGINRFSQTVQGKIDIEQTEIFKSTHNYLLGRINLVLVQYLSHFHPKFLFISGDENPRLSSQGAGEFYIIDSLFIILGIFYLIKRRSKENLLLLGWGLIGPLPSALFVPAPHAGRTAFMMAGWHLIAAIGAYYFINSFKKKLLKYIIIFIVMLLLGISLAKYFANYLTIFPKRYAIDWQYGMKQVVEYVGEHPEYPYVFMTDVRSQPYIFFLYYLKIPLPLYLNSVVYNRSASKSSNTVASFGKFYFAGWDPVVSMPNKEVLYVLTPSQYDGLMYRSSFNAKKVIYYPNNTTAFFIVSII